MNKVRKKGMMVENELIEQEDDGSVIGSSVARKMMKAFASELDLENTEGIGFTRKKKLRGSLDSYYDFKKIFAVLSLVLIIVNYSVFFRVF